MASTHSRQIKKKKNPRPRYIPKSDEKRLIIPFIEDRFVIEDYNEEQLGKRLPQEKLERMLKELDALIEENRIQTRKKWKIFVVLVVFLLAILVSFVVIVLAYGGKETDHGGIEGGKKGIAAVFIVMSLIIGYGWLTVGAQRARDLRRIFQALEEINRRRGVKKYNLVFKFGDNMQWLELYYDFKSFKVEEEKKKRENDFLLHGKITKKRQAIAIDIFDDEKSMKKEESGLKEMEFSIKLDDSIEKRPHLHKATTAMESSLKNNERPSSGHLDHYYDSVLSNSVHENDKSFGMHLIGPYPKKASEELELAEAENEQSKDESGYLRTRPKGEFEQTRIIELDQSKAEHEHFELDLDRLFNMELHKTQVEPQNERNDSHF